MSDKPLAYSYLRISTDNQRHGSGIERQMKAGAEWAEANGYELTETISDIGLSAYTSTHAKKGGFGRFLAAIETGQVPAGSILIVESLDRLSRAKVTEAFTQLVGLLKHGIKIVTLVDDQVYTESSLNENF
ncbi:recombinase family protein, partial [Rhodobacteraceae bacterium R_SAG4]|nr:recombinase family protein [Rhodobacteraceae bacterium R_SAG4]